MDLHEIIPSYAAHHQLFGRGEATLRERVNLWLRLGKDNADDFRRSAIAAGFTPWTIESTVNAIGRLVRFGGGTFAIGTRLRLPSPKPQPAELDEVGKLYAAASVAKWPANLFAKDRLHWWQSYILLSYWTAFRLSDIESLTEEHIRGAIDKPSAKTRKEHRIPIVPVVRRHIEHLPTNDRGTLFGFTQCRKQFRREFKRICEAAGIRIITPKNLRQAGVVAWTKADLSAGAIIQGSALRGSIAHYISAEVMLEQVADRVPFPLEMLSPEERRLLSENEGELVARFRRARRENKRMLLQMARCID